MIKTAARLHFRQKLSVLRQGRQPPDQRGAVAIEFAMIFTVLFGVFWLILAYSLPFFIYQVMSHAASESARSALHLDYTTQSDAQITAATLGVLTTQLGVLPTAASTSILASQQISIDNSVPKQKILTVTVTYGGCNTTTYRSTCLIPPLSIGNLGSIPNLPPFTIAARERLQ